MALEDIIVDRGEPDRAGKLGQRQHEAVRAAEPLGAKRPDKIVGLEVERELADAERLEGIVLVEDDLGVETERIVGDARLEAHALCDAQIPGGLGPMSPFRAAAVVRPKARALRADGLEDLIDPEREV